MERLINKAVIRNKFGLLETTDKLGPKHKFFLTRTQAAEFLRRLHSFRLYVNTLENMRVDSAIRPCWSIADQNAYKSEFL